MLEKKEIKKGTVIFNQGDKEDVMYDIVSGCVGIYLDYKGPNEKLLTKLEAIDYFGEMGLIDGEARSATAVALENTTLYVVTKQNFSDYMEECPTKVYMIMQQTSSRIRSLTGAYVNACSAIAEYIKNEEENKPQSKELIDRMKKIIQVAKKSRR